MTTQTLERPPRDGLVRVHSSFEMRSQDEGMPTMLGHFARFNEWTEVDSFFEGHFMERIAPGAFSKTFKENRSRIRVLFNHGHDPQIGDKVLGVPEELREDEEGAYYEVPLLDTSYNRDLLPGLEAGQYGSSFRFRVMKEQYDKDPGTSDHNPKGLPERTIQESHVMEFGPVTFPQYEGATAGVRSMTDQFYFGMLSRGEGLRKLAEFVNSTKEDDPPAPEPAVATPSEVRGPIRGPAWKL